MDILMQRYGRHELLKAIEDNEKRGFKVVSEIKSLTRGCRQFHYDDFRKKYDEFSHTEENTLYFVKMRGEKR